MRGVALQATAGLKRGAAGARNRRAVTVPVGEPVLGRLLDVTGNVRDNGPPLPDSLPRLPIHRSAAAAYATAAPATAIFETGIKVIDLLAPLAARRQGRDVRRRRRRQDRCGDGTDPRDGPELSGHLRLCRHRRALARGPRAAHRDAALRRARSQRAGLWPDERTAGRALARRPDGADDRRIFPRPEAAECAAADGQRVPLRAGRQRGLRPARAAAVAGRLPADAGHRSRRAARAHRLGRGRRRSPRSKPSTCRPTISPIRR